MKLRTLCGITVGLMALLLTFFHGLQLLSIPFGHSNNFYFTLFQILFNGFVVLLMAVSLLNRKRHLTMKYLCEYLQLVFLLVTATTAFFQSNNGIFGGTLLLLVILLGFFYRTMGKRSLFVLLFYIISISLFSSYIKGQLLEGVAASFFYLFYYFIIHMFYRGFLEREEKRRIQLRDIICKLQSELVDKDALIEQLNAVHYNVKDYGLTKSEKKLLDCIRLYREVGNKELSCLMGKSESTIRNSIHRICKKLGFNRRMKLLLFVMESPSEIEELPVIEEISTPLTPKDYTPHF